jgi:translation initiation factor 1A
VNFVIGKRKLLTESHLKELLLPQQSELPGHIVKAIGGDNIIVNCPVGKVMTCRIGGKIKRRMWIRENDLVLVAPWNFPPGRVDIIWQYIAAHADKLEQDGNPNDLRQMSDKVIVL